ncbi:hypothetical protein BL250_04140 [Erwinia sp. OLTSP20]|uniref:YdgA family protein n=1 Tax=unclassified Erwinia TaxID=2622719 RepID=UPI000C1804F1|nr:MULTISPECIES: YdgA family protein [unclassified Erwinia]PIJ51687.1 hypothetical protein BV501_03070 [Erwinia sp. OAMSP11]PIJ75574.1 hypothetical protein BK416_01365 [Erwinia sp. OLSSP12]PIJ84879.1 hypothetical protein BLD47_01295 [Erwinia sp. OLCASP19]PIJ86658.1 hypothetical protein BLD46_02895 [Erwinia sp. OLMTSP26]PIJ88099.1 hypothetical protein BLD49_03575 [Erwinia sp. OLMDSP33]
MKKTKIAVGVVVALGIILTGGAWFTGKKLEENRDQALQNANNWLQQQMPQAHLTLSYQDYQRGVFSSQVKLIIQSSSQTTDDALLKPGQSLVFQETLHHGPFPLSQLRKFNLIPSMASVHSELQNTDPVRKLFELTKDKPFISGDTRIGYGGDTTSDIRLLPLDYQDSKSGDRLAFNGGKLTVSADNQGNQLNYSGLVDDLAVTSKNDMGMPVLLSFNGLSFNGKTHPGAADLRVGNQSVDLKSFTTRIEDKEVINAQGLQLLSDFTSDSKNINGQFDYKMDAVKLQGQDFGSARLTVKLSQLDAASLKAFSENYRTQMQPLIDQPNVDPQLLQQKSREAFASNLPLLLKGNPVISIAPLSWKNAKGESTFNFTASLKDPSSSAAPADEGNINQMADNVVKSLDARLVIPMAMASEVMTRVGIAEGNSEEQSAKLADQQVKGFAAMGQMFKLTTQQDNNIVASLQFANGQITMNGEKMPLDQFISRYLTAGSAPEGLSQ